MRTPNRNIPTRRDPSKSTPPVTEPKKQDKSGIDVDDALIEEPKDDVFKKDANNTANRLPERDRLSDDVERAEGPERRR